MGLLARLRYVLDILLVPSTGSLGAKGEVALLILQVLIRVARHSPSAASQVPF